MDIVTLQCSSCKKKKPATDFHVDRTVPRGYTYACKECRNRKYLYSPEAKEKRAKIAREWRKTSPKAYTAKRRRRLEAIEKLGGKCECCGEGRMEFLAIDHINELRGRGFKRKPSESGEGVVLAVNRMEDPKTDFRLLCHNCNSTLGFYGYCPHKEPDRTFYRKIA